MSPDPATLPRRQIGVDQPQGGALYPFVAPSDQLEQVIGDLHLTYRDDDNRFLLPLRIVVLWGFGTAGPATPLPSHMRDVLITDALGEVVFDSRDADFTSRSWGPRLLVHQWLHSDNVLNIVEYASTGRDDPVVNLPQYLEPANGLLDSRTLYQWPLQVRSIRVGLEQIRGLGAIVKGGYNMAFTVSPTVAADGGRLQTIIRVDAVPGSGAGRYNPGPPADLGIRRINGISPMSNGNFIMDAADCYRIERPVQEILNSDPREVQIRDHALQVFNDCGPCCSCQDFINVYEAIRVLRNKYADLVARAQAARDTYVSNLQRYTIQRECRLNSSLRVVVQPMCPNFLDVAVAFCNNTGRCLKNLYLLMEFQHQEGDLDLQTTPASEAAYAEVACSSTYRSGNVQGVTKIGNQYRPASHMERYDLGGQWPYFWAHFDGVDPGAMATVSTRLHFVGADSGWNVVAVADAYENVTMSPVTDGSPVEGVVLGAGPVTAEAAAKRLVRQVTYAQSGLALAVSPRACCDSGDPAVEYFGD